MSLRRSIISARIPWITAVLGLLMILHYFNVANYHGRKFNFSIENTPYNELEDARCVLTGKRKWDCPDVRKLGKNKLRQTQLVTTRMLLMVDRLCKKHDIRYWIARGTLLGAARHRGHIPWDTDLDIEMPKDDYIKFVRKAKAHFPKGVTFQHHKQEADHMYLYNKANLNEHEKQVLGNAIRPPWNPRLRDDYSCFGNCLNEGCSWHDGLMIDIFPVSISAKGVYSVPFSSNMARFFWKVFGYQTEYQAFPLGSLQFEGYQMPVIYDWKKFLIVNYGENYMELPALSKRYPPGSVVPEPRLSCSRLKSLQSD